MGFFQQNKKNICPICGKTMVSLSGDLVCRECGYHASYGASNATDALFSAPGTVKAPTTISAKPQTATTYKQISVKSTGTAAKTSKKKKKASRGFIIAVASVLLVTILNIMVRNGIESFLDVFSNSYTPDAPQPEKDLSILMENYSTDIPELDPELTAQLEASLAQPQIQRTPLTENSDGIISLMETIFAKSAEEITPEELAAVDTISLTYYDYSYKVATCTLFIDNTYMTQELFLDESSFYGSDFSTFPNLTGLHMEFGSIDSLDGLYYLQSLSTDMTPEEITALIDPTQLLYLKMDDTYRAAKLEGIDAFTSLTSLVIDTYNTENIENLSKLPNLKSLTILDCEDSLSFKPLYDLTGLEELYLNCDNLKEIGFVSNMTNLQYLTIWNSQITNIDALADCTDTLKQLDLSYNYELTDYDIVSEMTKLENLSLYAPYSYEDPVKIPQLENMPNLTTLFLGNFDDLSSLTASPNLTSLVLSDTYVADLSCLASMPNVTSVGLYDTSLDPAAFKPLLAMPQLTSLDLYRSYIWGDASSLFSIPTLKALNMEDCTTQLDMDKLAPNDSLEYLNLNYAQLEEASADSWSYSDSKNLISLADHTDVFANYPNLRELYLAEQNLDDVSFASSLLRLETIDLTDNYVTDLSPLSELANLTAILCYNNPIVDNGGLGNIIYMD